jgi:MEMO1 family protein
MKEFYDSDYIPSLRKDLDFIPAQYQGKQVRVVRDPLGLIAESLILPEETIAILSLIDGQKSIRDLQLELIRINNGYFIKSEIVSDMLSNLDNSFLLESDRYLKEREKLVNGFAQEKIRKPYLAGKSYPDSGQELKDHLASFFRLPEGKKTKMSPKKVRVLLSPHIDLEVGKKIYVDAYSSIQTLNPKKVLLFGVGHSLESHLISLTDKDFNTPFGTVSTERKYSELLRKTGGKIIAPDDFAHRSEHSLEFQLIFLQYLFGNSFSIIPVLFGSFHKLLKSFSRPSDIPLLKDVLNVFKSIIDREGSDILTVAGVDFSHIGPKFGHRQPARSMLEETRAQDKRLIDAVCRNDVEAFWGETQKSGGRFNVCGFSAISCLLEIFSKEEGEILGYDIWEEELTQSAVSFAAIALY